MDACEKKRMLSSQTHQLIYSHVAVSTSVGLVGESKVRPCNALPQGANSCRQSLCHSHCTALPQGANSAHSHCAALPQGTNSCQQSLQCITTGCQLSAQDSAHGHCTALPQGANSCRQSLCCITTGSQLVSIVTVLHYHRVPTRAYTTYYKGTGPFYSICFKPITECRGS